jgi:NAD(P)-dependent dehydrogenase (short-subunit alcohol dehydrogenase family)
MGAVRIARAGARLALADLQAAELEATAAEVTAAGGSAVAVVADLAKPDDCAAVVQAAMRGHGRIDILFNNAGVGTMVVGGTVETIDLEHWDLAQDVNVRAIASIPPLLPSAGGGSIVNTASVAAFRGHGAAQPHLGVRAPSSLTTPVAGLRD